MTPPDKAPQEQPPVPEAPATSPDEPSGEQLATTVSELLYGETENPLETLFTHIQTDMLANKVSDKGVAAYLYDTYHSLKDPEAKANFEKKALEIRGLLIEPFVDLIAPDSKRSSKESSTEITLDQFLKKLDNPSVRESFEQLEETARIINPESSPTQSPDTAKSPANAPDQAPDQAPETEPKPPFTIEGNADKVPFRGINLSSRRHGEFQGYLKNIIKLKEEGKLNAVENMTDPENADTWKLIEEYANSDNPVTVAQTNPELFKTTIFNIAIAAERAFKAMEGSSKKLEDITGLTIKLNSTREGKVTSNVGEIPVDTVTAEATPARPGQPDTPPASATARPASRRATAPRITPSRGQPEVSPDRVEEVNNLVVLDYAKAIASGREFTSSTIDPEVQDWIQNLNANQAALDLIPTQITPELARKIIDIIIPKEGDTDSESKTEVKDDDVDIFANIPKDTINEFALAIVKTKDPNRTAQVLRRLDLLSNHKQIIEAIIEGKNAESFDLLLSQWDKVKGFDETQLPKKLQEHKIYSREHWDSIFRHIEKFQNPYDMVQKLGSNRRNEYDRQQLESALTNNPNNNFLFIVTLIAKHRDDEDAFRDIIIPAMVKHWKNISTDLGLKYIGAVRRTDLILDLAKSIGLQNMRSAELREVKKRISSSDYAQRDIQEILDSRADSAAGI